MSNVFLCKKCSDDFCGRYGELESLCIGVSGIKKCEQCGIFIEIDKNDFGLYHIHRSFDMANSVAKYMNRHPKTKQLYYIPECIKNEVGVSYQLGKESILTSSPEEIKPGVIKGTAKFEDPKKLSGKNYADKKLYTVGNGLTNKDKGKVITFSDGSEHIIKKVINRTTITIKERWPLWFWKIRVPEWMLTKISFGTKNRWINWFKYKGCFIIILGFEYNVGGEYQTRPAERTIDITIFNFGFKCLLRPHREVNHYGIYNPIITPNCEKTIKSIANLKAESQWPTDVVEMMKKTKRPPPRTFDMVKKKMQDFIDKNSEASKEVDNGTNS